jgi:hypothetical protein
VIVFPSIRAAQLFGTALSEHSLRACQLSWPLHAPLFLTTCASFFLSFSSPPPHRLDNMHTVLPALTVVLLALSNAANAQQQLAKPLGRRDVPLADLSSSANSHLQRRSPSFAPASNSSSSSSTSPQLAPKHKKHKKRGKNCRPRSATSSLVVAPATTSSVKTTTTAPSSSSTATTTRSTSAAASSTPSTSPSSSLYSLTQESLGGYSFFDNWDFFNYPDPTHGQVDYVDEATAWKNGLVYVPDEGKTAVLRTDSWSWLGYGQERQSVRITSKEKVTFGSITIADFEKMPYGCVLLLFLISFDSF